MSLYVDIRKKLGGFTLETQFEAADGVTGILGASGCGKSMTLRCIAGIVKPDEGHIELDGKVLFDSREKINLRPQERHVGLLFQNYALFPNMTVRQNLMTGLKAEKTGKKEAELRAMELLTLLGLADRVSHKPNQLSGGEQQRVSVARALVNHPRVVLADEPSGNLDTRTKNELHQLFFTLREELGQTFVIVTHDTELARMSDRQIKLNDGMLMNE